MWCKITNSLIKRIHILGKHKKEEIYCHMILPVILAGGSGTRLWPLSRELYPKQLISLLNEKSMLQNTLLRLQGMENLLDPLVTCNEENRFMTAEHLKNISVNSSSIVLEPVGRNTAPAIAVSAILALERHRDPVLLVLPADHVITDTASFQETVKRGHDHAEAGGLVTFGIVPQSAETGYGYIRKGESLSGEPGVYKIERFVEKPCLKDAQHYAASGDYCWNSGMFMFKASTVISEIEAHAPDIVRYCRKAVEKGKEDMDFFRLDLESFEKAPSDSIDYKVMEKTTGGVMIACDIGWNDLGSFDALWQTGRQDEKRNVIKGDVLAEDVTDSYINSQNRLVAAVGLDGYVIVETKDAVLVAARDRVGNVKGLVEKLRKNQRPEAVTHSRVYRPWGAYETVDTSERFQVKRLSVKPGARLSLQKHYHRAEHWTVVSGTAFITRGEETMLLKEDQSTYIPLGVKHRLENPGRIPLELIEVQSGAYLGEDDIVRYEDVYGRKEDQEEST